MKTRTTLKLSALMLCVTVSAAMAADWPHWRGPDYTGISKETDWNPQALSDPKVVWEAEIGIGFSSPSIADGKTYAMGNIDKNKDIVFCFDALTGKELWRFEYLEPLNPKYYEGGSSATPTVHDGKVYTLSKSGKIHCLNAETGKPIWNFAVTHKEPTWGFASSGLVLGDKIIFNIGASGLALNKDTGDILWDSDKSESGYATPVPFTSPDGKQRIAIFGKDTVMAIDPADGKVVWSYPWKTQNDVNAADPIIAGDEMLISSGYNHGATLLKIAPAPTQVWENKNLRCQMSPPVRIGEHIYGIDQNQLVCVEWKTGEQIWAQRSVNNGSLTAAGDRLIVASENGRIMIVQATTEGFKELSGADLLSARCWAPPVLANGHIYARSSKGKLICVDVRNP